MAFGTSDRIPILGRRWGGKCDYETVRKSLDASLARLNLSYVDLYYTHRVLSKESGTCTFREDFRPPLASHRPPPLLATATAKALWSRSPQLLSL